MMRLSITLLGRLLCIWSYTTLSSQPQYWSKRKLKLDSYTGFNVTRYRLPLVHFWISLHRISSGEIFRVMMRLSILWVWAHTTLSSQRQYWSKRKLKLDSYIGFNFTRNRQPLVHFWISLSRISRGYLPSDDETQVGIYSNSSSGAKR